MITTKIDTGKKIVYANYSGSIRLNDISEFYSQLAKDHKDWVKLRLIQNEKDAEFPETSLVIKNAKNLMDILTSNFRSIRLAIVQHRPVETAYSYLFLENSSAKNYSVKVFSEEENAVKWIDA